METEANAPQPVDRAAHQQFWGLQVFRLFDPYFR
jgi:hypothetical protein